MIARTLVAALVIAIGAAGPVFARNGGSSSSGDSYLNDAVRNPRFIEPYAGRDPSRYRVSNPSEGYVDRQIARDRFYHGGVYVRPFYGR